MQTADLRLSRSHLQTAFVAHREARGGSKSHVFPRRMVMWNNPSVPLTRALACVPGEVAAPRARRSRGGLWDGGTRRGGAVRSHPPHEELRDAEVWEHGVRRL